MFNPFDICVVDKSDNKVYKKNNIKNCLNYENLIILLELKNKFYNRNIKLGDIFFDEKEKMFYVFTSH